MRPRAADLSIAGIAAVIVGLGAHDARHRSVRTSEARVFTGVNHLSERAHAPVWTVMQMGSLGGSIATGLAVAARLDRRLGVRLAWVGSLAWLGSKLVKQMAQRERPTSLVAATRVLGREPAGLGYPSGHAAVATGMASVASTHASRGGRAALWTVAGFVGVSRMYVGAHLPLDVLGGAALGLGTERLVRALKGPA